ncbi:MAG: serine hydrolase [Pseudomonadota bacterium]
MARADVATAPIGNREEVLQPPYLLGSWTQMAQIYPARTVSRAGPVRELPIAGRQLGRVGYDYGDTRFTLDDYLRRNDGTSMLVIMDGAIVFETYRMGTAPTTAFTSWSMGKSLTSTLLGIAIERGFIESETDLARDYVPELEASGYRDVTLRDLLQMSSGVKFVEDYTKPNSKEGQS